MLTLKIVQKDLTCDCRFESTSMKLKKTVFVADAKKTYKDVRKKPLQSHDATKSLTQIR